MTTYYHNCRRCGCTVDSERYSNGRDGEIHQNDTICSRCKARKEEEQRYNDLMLDDD
ncbi:hypothetical protein [Aeromonas caviae]